MKLRNKKTGQLGNFIINKDHFECVDLDYVPEYRNLAELEREWEDYEELENFYIVEQRGTVGSRFRTGDEYEKMFKEIGNYFETKEEAEKAVEKLKAWKRLKDKGFRFSGYCRYDTDGEKYPHMLFSYPNFDALFDDGETVADLNLLFRGEA